MKCYSTWTLIMDLIYLVLNSFSLYYFSFYKAPRRILNKLIQIERNFLWESGLEGKKSKLNELVKGTVIKEGDKLMYKEFEKFFN